MPMPSAIGIIDLMLAIPGDDNRSFYDWIKPLLLDKESHDMFSMPAQCFGSFPGRQAGGRLRG